MVKSKTFGKDLRLLVIESFKNGFSTKKIFENLQKTVSIQTIRRWILQFKRNGQIEAKQSLGRRSIRNRDYKKRVRQCYW